VLLLAQGDDVAEFGERHGARSLGIARIIAIPRAAARPPVALASTDRVASLRGTVGLASWQQRSFCHAYGPDHWPCVCRRPSSSVVCFAQSATLPEPRRTGPQWDLASPYAGSRPCPSAAVLPCETFYVDAACADLQLDAGTRRINSSATGRFHDQDRYASRCLVAPTASRVLSASKSVTYLAQESAAIGCQLEHGAAWRRMPGVL